jgi:predicted peroxiredoxin
LSSCDSGKTAETKPDSLLLAKPRTDSIENAVKDSIRIAGLKATAYFPLLKAGDGAGVLPVKDVDEIPDANREYKLLFEFTSKGDTSSKKINPGLLEICRVLNLHIASGIALSHIHPVVVTRGKALFSIMNNESYSEKFKKSNPNDSLINQLMTDGARFIACGQSMQYSGMKKEQLHQGVKIALTAQVVKSNYLGQGYVLYDVADEK